MRPAKNVIGVGKNIYQPDVLVAGGLQESRVGWGDFFCSEESYKAPITTCPRVLLSASADSSSSLPREAKTISNTTTLALAVH